MTANNADFNPQERIAKGTFTIPVEIMDRDDETGAEIKREILVTYHYDQDTQDEFRKGVEEEVDNPEHAAWEIAKEQWENAHKTFTVAGGADPGEAPKEPDAKIKVRRDPSNEEQVRILTKKIKGVETLDEAFWRKTPPKHKKAILEAIMEDIFPNTKSSGA